jgi:hypothetical protein
VANFITFAESFFSTLKINRIMKKVLFLILAVVFFVKSGFSQDVIVTKSGESIRAKILEVTEENISYKKYKDMEGATFILKKENIKLISWENGDVDDYEKALPQQEETEVVLTDISAKLPYILKRQSKIFFLDNGQTLNEEQMKNFLMEKNLTPVWITYSSGKRLLNTGLIMIGGGVLLQAIGWTMMSVGADAGDIGCFFAGSILYVGGGATAVAGIPIAIVGGCRRSQSVKDYNTLYGGKPRPQYSQNVTLNAVYTGSGLGFTLNF